MSDYPPNATFLSNYNQNNGPEMYNFIMFTKFTERAFAPIFFCLEGSWGQPQGPNFPSP